MNEKEKVDGLEIDRDIYMNEERPYENEHSCRLHPPGNYDKFARKNCEIKHDGKCIDVIYGIKEGKSEIQAYRYPKKSWDADDARSHCKSHDGSFEAAKEGKEIQKFEDRIIGEMLYRKFKVGVQYRHFAIEEREINEEKRTVGLTFSSEDPVERWWGIEILDHKPESVNLRRLKKGGSVLVDHDMTKLVGVIEKVSIDETVKKGRATVRFGKRGLADDIFQDVLDKLRTNVSVGYQIDGAILEKEQKGKPNIYRVKWEPYEISVVAVPQDINVGIGRNISEGAKEIEIQVPMKKQDDRERIEIIPKMEERKMNGKCEKCQGNLVDGKCPVCETQRAIEAQAGSPKGLTALQLEERRIQAIKNLCKLNELDERYEEMWIGSGTDVKDVSEDLLKIKEKRDENTPKSKVGMGAREVREYSIVRAIRACEQKEWSKIAPFELECSRAVSDKLRITPDPNKFYIPYDVLERPMPELGRGIPGRRDVSVAASGGAYLVGTENVGFIELLRNRSVVFRLGATRLTGLQGNVTIPKQSAAATAYWLSSETTEVTESQQTFVQVGLSPKNCGAYTEISRQLLLQSSPGVEAIVNNDLATVVALAVDVGVLRGSGGAGQPQGIVGTSGIGSVTGTSLAASGIIEFMTDVAASNVTPLRPGYVTTSAVAGLLMDRPELTSTGTTRLWLGNLWNGSMFGIPAMSSEQMSSATMLFGDWASVIVAEWGVLEVEVNPYANFQAGIIGIRAMYSIDAALRYAGAFSYASSIT